MAIRVDWKLKDHRLPYKMNITTTGPSLFLPYRRAQVKEVDFSSLSGEHTTFQLLQFS